MDEVWERAVETALEGQTDFSSTRVLTLDGAVKCVHGRLPPPLILERFQSLEHLSIANVGVSSLEKFPRLPNLQKLILSDNRIAGGLEFLVQARLASLRDLDLSNNRIQYVEDLAPLAQLKLVSLDLYECPVTRVEDYRSRVFGMIRSLKYLDKMDADQNERPESDDDDDDDDDDEVEIEEEGEEEEEELEDDDDPGSGEVDREDRCGKTINGGSSEGIVVADEDEESDADEEETEAANGLDRAVASHPLSNGFRVAAAPASAYGDEDEEDVEDEEEDDLGEEIDEESDDDTNVVEVQEIDDSEEDEDGVEEDEDEDEHDDAEPGSTGRLTSTEGEIDGHEQGEEDENGEIGEEDGQGVEEDGEYEEEEDDGNGDIGEEDDQGVEEDGDYEDGDGEDEEEDFRSEYRVQPIRQAEEETGVSDLDPGNEDDGEEEEVEDEEDHYRGQLQPSSHELKRKRADGNGNGSLEHSRPPKDSKHH